MKRAVPALLLAVAACYPTTTRPDPLPVPDAVTAVIDLFIPEATRAVALAMYNDSLPVRRTEPRDGWLETEWFDATTLRPTNARRIGTDVVKVRAWVDPDRPNHSRVTIEAVYRTMEDPSRDPRLLEQSLPGTHPVQLRINSIIVRLQQQYADVIELPDTPATPPPVKPDSARPDSSKGGGAGR